MSLSNFERMVQLANEAFSVTKDPGILKVDEKVIQQLDLLHPVTLSEYVDGDGPVVWVLLIPTTQALMHQFINKGITETELLEFTPIGIQYEALYLCSALTLPEFRSKGLTKQVAIDAIEAIRKTHPIQTLFVWSFSKEGATLAEAIAKYENLPLLECPR